MRFESFLTETSTLAEQISAHQAGTCRIDMHHSAAGKVQRAISCQEATAPHHVGNRQVGNGEPDSGENHYRREADTLGKAPHHQRDGDTSE
ncbi:hypothetical protein D3C71_1803800 [compost metagenome]